VAPISVGIAGLGRFGRLHAGVINRLPGAAVAAVFDPEPAARDDAVRDFGGPVPYDSFDELLAHPDLDCVYIVSPEDTHEAMVEQAIERGLPIFLEKPLALSSARGAEIAQKADRSGVYLQIGFVVRFEVRCAFLRDQIRDGAFGRIASFRAKRNCSRAWFDVYGDRAHSVYETIIHDIDYLLWLIDSTCRTVYALEQNFSGKTYPDATMALLQFENGVMASMETSWLAPDRAPANVLTDTWYGTIDSEIEVVGEKRSARLRILESGLEIWTDDVSYHPEFGLWPEINGAIGGALRAEDEHFLHVVATGEPSTITSVGDAVAGLRIAEAIVESARSGQEVRLG
jgi:predicted dehydrogenase